MNTKATLLAVISATTASFALSPLSVLAQAYQGTNPDFANRNYPTGGTCYVPAGMTLSANLQTSVSTEAARPGDLVEAVLTQPIMTGNGTVPAGCVLEGHVASASSGGFFTKAGRVTLQFDRLRTPNGMTVPMAAHILGDLGKYKATGNGSYAGEGAGTKFGQAALRTAIGAAGGAALGTAVGAIAGHGMTSIGYRQSYMPFGHGYGMMPVGYQPYYRSGAGVGAGRGAWSGAAIGGGVGLADSLLLRKGKNVNVSGGTPIQLQLDSPIQLDQHAQYGAT